MDIVAVIGVLSLLSMVGAVVWQSIRQMPRPDLSPMNDPLEGVTEQDLARPVEAPASAPEISCFVKGIARSIIEQPESWEETDIETRRREGWHPIPVIDAVSTSTGVRLIAFGQSRVPRPYLEGCKHITHIKVMNDNEVVIEPAEALHLALAIEAHPILQLKQQLEAEVKRERRIAEAQAHFTSLGCPSTTVLPPIDPPSST